MSDESTLIVPLRSNAHTLLSGRPIESLRRRLKYASVLYDSVLLEAGAVGINAGPGGSATMTIGAPQDTSFHWQTPAGRRAASKAGFSLAVGREKSCGVPAEELETVVTSSGTIAWLATLEPFADEMPAGCDWIHFASPRVVSPLARKLRDEWTRLDKRNKVLAEVFPDDFSRNLVIDHANRDVALISTANATASIDATHAKVFRQGRARSPGTLPHWSRSGRRRRKG